MGGSDGGFEVVEDDGGIGDAFSKAERNTNPDKNNWDRSQCWSLREMSGNDDSSRTAHIERLVTSQQPWKSASGDAADFVRLDPSEPEPCWTTCRPTLSPGNFPSSD
jgi:hypothetical protein